MMNSLDRPSIRKLFLRFRDSTLDTKVAISVIFVGAVGFALIFAALTSVILPRFDALEQQTADRHIQQIQTALNDHAKGVETSARDYGVWDDSHSYMQTGDLQFQDRTMSVSALVNLEISGMAYARLDGTPVFVRWIDPENEVDLPSQTTEFTAIVKSIINHQQVEKTESLRFYARVGGKISAIGAARIVHSDGSGAPNGYVVMARELTDQELSEMTQLNTKLSLARRKPAPAIALDTKLMHIAVNVPGIDGARLGQVKFSLPRDLSVLGQNTLLLAVISCAIVLVFALSVVRTLMRKIMITPLAGIQRHMQRVRDSGELKPLVGDYTKDEVGSLTSDLNSMLRQLKDLRERLEINSFELGRTESAVGVMHNVRNGLNPISVILSKLESERPLVSLDDVERAHNELQDPNTTQDRRVRIVQFLKAALQATVDAGNKRRADLSDAKICLNTVVELIGKQQASAHRKADMQRCELAEVVRQNEALARFSASGNIRYEVQPTTIEALGNRLLLSQVIGNLFSNSIEAITAIGRNNGLIEVSFQEEDGFAQIRIRDNGEGFDPERGAKIFERGFSTREQKSGGLGLHWCANALGMMNAKLELVSDGPGLGATAIITLLAASDHPQDAEDKAQPSLNDDTPLEAEVLETQNRPRLYGT
jgi:signal transduction histidine kinase